MAPHRKYVASGFKDEASEEIHIKSTHGVENLVAGKQYLSYGDVDGSESGCESVTVELIAESTMRIVSKYWRGCTRVRTRRFTDAGSLSTRSCKCKTA